MITLQLASPADLTWCQALVTKHHYLHAPVDTRCAPLAYVVLVEHAAMLPQRVGCLIFGRPEATRCYSGGLTYGSMADVRKGRAQYDRWEILNLARVWLSPRVQAGGIWCRSSVVPGFVDRRGLWRSTVASSVIEQAIERVGYDYLMQRLPCFVEEPYEIKVVLSYCDTRKHRGTIYRAAGFALARTNDAGIETWHRGCAPLSNYQRDMVEKLAGQSWRSRRHRARRAVAEQQEQF